LQKPDGHLHLCEREHPRSPLVWEWTRYCVRRDQRGGSVLGGVGSELLLGAVEWCLDRRHPARRSRTSSRLDRLFHDAGVRPLGRPTKIDGEPVIAVRTHFDEAVLARTREIFSGHKPELAAGLRRSRPAKSLRRRQGAMHERRCSKQRRHSKQKE